MVVDGHSHIGNEKFSKRGEITLDAYLDYAKKVGIDIGLIMPVPCPIIPEDCGLHIGKVLLTWKYDEDLKKHIDMSEEQILIKRGLKNPYKEINSYYYKKVNSYDDDVKLLFVPIIHPRLDTPEYLEELIKETDPVAVKIHSVGTLSLPENMTQKYTEVLQKYDIPVIVHTDFNNGKFDSNIGLHEAVEKADANKWFEYFENNQIRGTLNHGAALNLDVFEKINKSKFVKIGIEPSIYFGGEYGRLNIDKDIYDKLGFLGVIKEYLDPSKVIFDVDYDYNQLYEGGLDYNTIKRIKDMWNSEDQEKVLFKNAFEQYPKIIKKIRR